MLFHSIAETFKNTSLPKLEDPCLKRPGVAGLGFWKGGCLKTENSQFRWRQFLYKNFTESTITQFSELFKLF
jgi:hypothetical protein